MFVPDRCNPTTYTGIAAGAIACARRHRHLVTASVARLSGFS